MKRSLSLLMALMLGTGLMPAAAQEKKPVILPAKPPVTLPRRPQDVPPPPDSAADEKETPLLGANYRISISAVEKGQDAGALSVQTCASVFAMEGYLSLPTAENPTGNELTLRGKLSELEGGALRLGYSLATLSRVPTSTVGIPTTGQVINNYSNQRNGASGVLMLQPGRSCELMRISGVVYSLTIARMETGPAAKPSAPAPADAEKNAKARPGENTRDTAPRRGPTDEDRRRYESLSSAAQEKFRNAMRQHFADEKFRNSPEDVRRAKIRELFDKAEAEDKAGSR